MYARQSVNEDTLCSIAQDDLRLRLRLRLRWPMVNGSLHAMNLRINMAGRLVLPKAVRQQLGITPETALELIPSADWAGVIDGVREERADSAWAP